MKNIKYIVLTLMMLFPVVSPVAGQERIGQKRAVDRSKFSVREMKTEIVPPDSLELARLDSLARADSTARADSIGLASLSSLEMPAFSTAKDSIVEVFSNGHKLIYYYGDVTVKYMDMELSSAYMEYDMDAGTVYARGVYDTLTHAMKGQPVMTQGGASYNMEEVRYNFNTRRARITNMVTNQQEAILHGNDIKMMEDQSINLKKGKYTVCELEHPHYYLQMSSAKVMTKPKQKTVFGPACVVLGDVKIPFIGLPFGFVPDRPKRATGILMPTFGEEERRGFYIRDIGMYVVLGNYFDLSVTGDFFTLGSWAVNVNSRYKVNYKFNGSLSFNYNSNKFGEKGTSEYSESTDFGFRWTHAQDAKAHPGSTFSASVNFSTPTNSKNNSHSIGEALQNQISSSISYSKNWNGKFNLSVNALHSQNSKDSSYSFTLPNVSFSVSTFYPFKRKNRVGSEKFYEKISFGYSTQLQNSISFKSSEFGQPGFTDKFKNGMSHNFSLGLPSFQLFKYITVNPSVSYGMNWMFRKTYYEYDHEQDTVVRKETPQFGAFGVTQTYSLSASVSTRLYGMFNFKKYNKVQAIRHIITPTLSFSGQPDLRTYANGYRTLEYIDKGGNARTYDYNVFEGQMYGYPSSGPAASANIVIGNNLEAKVRDYADTTGKGTKIVKLIDQLNISTGYNFLADSLRMSNIAVNMSTNLFGKVNISASASFDPYAYDKNGNRIGKFSVAAGQGLLHMLNANASVGYSINGKGTVDGNAGGSTSESYKRVFYHPVTGEFIPGGWLYYTNPNVPWSMNFNYSFSCTRSFKFNEEKQAISATNNITQTLGFGGNLRLTPRLNITVNSGFDFTAMKLSTTQLSATYDLHCWNIAVSWVPMGTWQSYSFRISANASALADLLKFRKSSSYFDNY